MGWEDRDGHAYYYRKERVNGRVRSVYVSTAIASLAAGLDQHSRIETVAARRLIDYQRGEDRKVIAACRKVRRAVVSVLVSAGFHQHKGEWRRWRMAKATKSDEDNALARAALAETELIMQAMECEEPSEAARAAVDRALAAPNGWRVLGDLLGDALGRGMQYAGAGYLGIESLRRGVEEMRAEFGFERSTLAERLLIEQILLCWLRLGVLERAQTSAMKGQQSFVYLGYLETATTLAQRRYTNAIQALARVRKLMQRRAPRVQVNALVVSDHEPAGFTIPAADVRHLEG